MGDTFRNSLCAHAHQADRASLKWPGVEPPATLPGWSFPPRPRKGNAAE